MSKKSTQPSNMVQVDAYMIPVERAEQYIADRETLAALAIELMTPFCASVERCWQGSEDGEAIVGLNGAGEILSMIHLDPDGIKLLDNVVALKEYLQPGHVAS